MRKIPCAFALLMLTACSPKSLSTHDTNNPEFKIEVMGDFDGCRIYRFADDKYFVRCGGLPTEAIIATHQESCGKNCVRTVDDTIYTERK